MVEFVEWLRGWNTSRAERDATGIFGMDLYSMHASIDAVLSYLDKVDPEAARRARRRYGCFELFGEDPQAYGYATTRGHAESCEAQVLMQSLPRAVPFVNIVLAMYKSAVFGVLIALIACYFGLKVKPNTESLGQGTTSSVVTAITVVILADAVFAIVFNGVGYY